MSRQLKKELSELTNLSVAEACRRLIRMCRDNPDLCEKYLVLGKL